MKVVILAAGMGRRLGFNMPKALVPIYKDKTILDHQLENLTRLVNITDILVVVGYKAELIQRRYPYLNYIYNPNYAKTNTSKSLLMALEHLKNSQEDVLWINGDVVFDPEILEIIRRYRGENFIGVNVNPTVGEEEVKYNLSRPEGYIKEISKTVLNPLGEAVGINHIIKFDLPIFIDALRECNDMDYFERGIEISIKNGVKFKPLYIGEKFCVEIDFREDLEKARKWAEEYYGG